MEILIVLLTLEICIICVLVAVCLCCKMGRRKRKIQDVETGSSENEPLAKKRKTSQSEVIKWDAVTYSLEPKGIPNVGASCFMNSMLQCLSWSPCFINQLRHQIANVKSGKYQGKLATTFLKLLQLNRTKYDVRVGPKKKKDAEYRAQKKQKDIVKKFCKEMAKKKDNFDGRTQQDSFECFNTIISGLEEEALENYPFRPNNESPTFNEHIMRTCDVTRLFGGMFITSYCYKECGHVESVIQRFTSLSLPPVAKKKVTIEKTDPTLTTKQRSPHKTSPLSVKPKKEQPSKRNLEMKNFSESEDDTTTPGVSLRRSTRSDNEKTPLIKTNNAYGSIPTPPKNQTENEANRDLTPISSKTDSASTSKSEKNTAVYSCHESVPQLHLTRACLRSSNGNTKDVPKDDVTESYQSAKDKDDQKSLSEQFPDDARRLFSMRLGRNKRKPKKRSGLELGLDKWSEFEKMMAVDLPCRTCDSPPGGVLYRHTKLMSLPNVLVLHINRFEQKGRSLFKVEDFISYPKALDMTSYCSKTLENLESDQDNVTQGQKKYSLFSVVNHNGTMKGGHYYAYIKTNRRDVTVIQNLLRNSWKDPEDVASCIRSKLEEIWQEGRVNGTPTKRRIHEDLVNETKTGLSEEDPQGIQDVSKEQGRGVQGYGVSKGSFDQQAPGRPKGHDPQSNCGRNESFDQQTSDVMKGPIDQRDSHDLKRPENKKTDIAYKGNKQDKYPEVPPTGSIHHKDKTFLQGNQEGCFIEPQENKVPCRKKRKKDVQENTDTRQDEEQLDNADEEGGKGIYRKDNMQDTGGNKGHQDTVSEESKTGTGRKKGYKGTVSDEDKITPDEKDTDIATDGDGDDPDRLECSKESVSFLHMDESDRTKGHGTKWDQKGSEVQKDEVESDKKIREEDTSDEGKKKGDIRKKDDLEDIELKGEAGNLVESGEENNVQKRRKNRSGEKSKDMNSHQDVIMDEKRDDDFSHKDMVLGDEENTSSDDSERRKKETQDLWYYVSDSLVHIEKEDKVLSSEAAYILMYERI
ncbi:ubiquitin carboxyl-terminal hydrolase 16-like isoform X2 [Pecten maximus]|uniref:ubiquitin carboxyl-terminal hydrolase 16-like isoform X2 n=1 Tax=Pecten maximus TaxID=6579 RepID=UPI0014588FAE|nr:ubiquitin carboxyl-terminal hydrolase 16-like isoform X2 [Pecten maximus]